MQIGDLNFGVLGKMGILHCNQNTLLEEVFVDESTVPLWHQHSEKKDNKN